jgi:hypothetical protein
LAQYPHVVDMIAWTLDNGFELELRAKKREEGE